MAAAAPRSPTARNVQIVLTSSWLRLAKEIEVVSGELELGRPIMSFVCCASPQGWSMDARLVLPVCGFVRDLVSRYSDLY